MRGGSIPFALRVSLSQPSLWLLDYRLSFPNGGRDNKNNYDLKNLFDTDAIATCVMIADVTSWFMVPHLGTIITLALDCH